MIDAAADGLKTLLSPGSPWPLLLLATFCAFAGLSSSRRRAPSMVLAALCAAYWIGSLPAVADGLATGFGRLSHKAVDAGQLDGIQAIVVLGAGASSYESAGRVITTPSQGTALNALEGVRLFNLTGGRIDIVASGGIVSLRSLREPEAEVLRGLLVANGVPAPRIVLETESRTTHEQTMRVGAMLKSHGWRRVAVVTSPVHLARAVGGFAVDGNPRGCCPCAVRERTTRSCAGALGALARSARSDYGLGLRLRGAALLLASRMVAALKSRRGSERMSLARARTCFRRFWWTMGRRPAAA